MTVRTMILRSVITCPQCGPRKRKRCRLMLVPFFYECTDCGERAGPEKRRLLCILLIRLCGLSSEAGWTGARAV